MEGDGENVNEGNGLLAELNVDDAGIGTEDAEDRE
jgi:hypothetical protein